MNQILSVEPPNNKNKNKNKSSIKSILVVFAIILMLFGIGLASTGAYTYYKNLSNNQENGSNNSTKTKPVISTDRESSSVINIVVTHDKEIAKIVYTINDGEPVQIDGNGKSSIEEEVELPTGDSTITITAEDINGISSSYQSSYVVEQKPTITLKQVDNKIAISVKSEIDINYVAYYWDDNKENGVKVDVNAKEYERMIDVQAGLHTLNVLAVDTEENETKKTQKIMGDNKPELSVKTDGEYFIIKAKDDEELSKIEVTLNSKDKVTETINGKEYSTKVKLENGENKIIVTVYNKNELSETSRVKYTKE